MAASVEVQLAIDMSFDLEVCPRLMATSSYEVLNILAKNDINSALAYPFSGADFRPTLMYESLTSIMEV